MIELEDNKKEDEGPSKDWSVHLRTSAGFGPTKRLIPETVSKKWSGM